MDTLRCAIIGAGNLAWHLSQLLTEETVVISRQPQNHDNWPRTVIDLPRLADHQPDIVFLAVPDSQIAAVSRQLLRYVVSQTLIIHTSGATPLEAVTSTFPNRGVLWPIRSLHLGEPVTNWRDLPLVIYASNAPSRRRLETLARSLSNTVSYLDDRQRAQLHLAAVFSNNFVTALYDVAHQLCTEYRVPFELLLPIIRHTAAQQSANPPRDRQTGAAARGDTVTMERHLALLDRPAYADLYRRISALILQYRLPQHHPHLGGEADNDL